MVRIEHIAFNVDDPIKVAEWYCQNLGMKVARKIEGAPYMHFLADEAGKVVIELYHQEAPVPDYASMHPMVLHIAFVADDIHQEHSRLQQAGCKPDGDIITTPAGDVMCFLRDPWGLTIQLVKRATPLM